MVVVWHSFSGGKDQTIKESFSNFMQRVENGSVVGGAVLGTRYTILLPTKQSAIIVMHRCLLMIRDWWTISWKKGWK